MSLLLHTDKNSHPGATEAFKKLQHAYEEVKAGNRIIEIGKYLKGNTQTNAKGGLASLMVPNQ